MAKKGTFAKSYDIDMINGSIMPKLITFFVPLMLSSVLQLFFNAVDLMVVGRWAGRNSLAAVGATTSLIHMFSNLLIGISLGANVVVARYIASEDQKNASESVHTSITFALIMGIFVTVFAFLFSRIGLKLMGTPPEILGKSVIYMKIYFVGMPFFALYNYGAAILRAAGDTKRPLYYLVIAGVLNAVLNMILVIVVHLDVVGVSVATAFSQMVSCILVLRCLVKSKEMYRLDFKNLHINKNHLLNILKIGVPSGLQSTVINFSNVLLQSSVNSFGAVAMAGYTAANNVLGFMYVSVNSITQACMSFTRQNYAVGKGDRVKKVLLRCLLLECIVSFVLGSIVYLFGTHILGIYTDSGEVISYGMEVFQYTALTYFLCGVMDCIPGSLRGMGSATTPMIFAIIGTVGTRIVWILGVFPHHRSVGFLFITYPLSWILTILMQSGCLIYVMKKKLGRKINR